MGLPTDIQDLKDRTLVALGASHDYFTFTKRVWRLVPQLIQEGRVFTFRNPTTGTVVDEHQLSGKVQRYVADYHLIFTFQHFVCLFEDFMFDLVRLWLAAYPGSLSQKQLTLATVLKTPDQQSIIMAVVDKELNDLKYERVAVWFAYLDKLVKLGCPSPDEIDGLAEIKATRDVLVHNKGIANATYVAKAGRHARCQVGAQLGLPEAYHRAAWELIRKVVTDLSEAAIKRA